MRSSALIAALSVCSLIAGSSSALASTVQYLSNDDLVARSTSIVRGKVLSNSGIVRRTAIYTSYRVRVLEVLKGQVGPQVDIAVPGGVAGGYRELVSGAPRLFEGDEYVFFLWTSPSGLTQILGMSQGLFVSMQAADGTRMAIRAAAPGMTMVDLKSGQEVADKETQISMADLRKRVARLGKGPAK